MPSDQRKSSLRIAVATEDGKYIAQHFGRSPFFAIYEVTDGSIINHSLRKNTFTGHFTRNHAEQAGKEHHHHGSGESDSHQSVVNGLGDCSVVISRGMGRKAWEDLRAKGLEMIVTDQQEVGRAVELYLAGSLEDRTEKLH